MAEITNSQTVERLLAHWRADSLLNLGPPVTARMLANFEHRHSVTLPPTMRAYLQYADGFIPPGNQDAEGFSFWPLAQITSLSDYRDGKFGHNHDLYLFLDYLDWSWAYAVEFCVASSPVYLVGTADGKPELVSKLFDEFIDLYIRDDPRIYVR